jgi:hypothetical protein
VWAQVFYSSDNENEQIGNINRRRSQQQQQQQQQQITTTTTTTVTQQQDQLTAFISDSTRLQYVHTKTRNRRMMHWHTCTATETGDQTHKTVVEVLPLELVVVCDKARATKKTIISRQLRFSLSRAPSIFKSRSHCLSSNTNECHD